MNLRPNVIGFDLSLTRSGVATRSGQMAITTNTSRPREWRIRHICQAVAEIIQDQPDREQILAVVESTFTRNDAENITIGVSWAVRTTLYDLGVAAAYRTPGQIKIFGYGSASLPGKNSAQKKRNLKTDVEDRTGLIFAGTDECEAFLAYCMGREMQGMQHPMRIDGHPMDSEHRRAIDGMHVIEPEYWDQP